MTRFQKVYSEVLAKAPADANPVQIARVVADRMGIDQREAFALCQRARLDWILSELKAELESK